MIRRLLILVLFAGLAACVPSQIEGADGGENGRLVTVFASPT